MKRFGVYLGDSTRVKFEVWCVDGEGRRIGGGPLSAHKTEGEAFDYAARYQYGDKHGAGAWASRMWQKQMKTGLARK
jgi:hypothetical protein